MGKFAELRGFFHDVEAPLKELWVNKIHYLLLSNFFSFLGLMLLVPYTPTLLTDYFAGARAGHPVKCTDLAAGVQPPAACKSAHDDVVQWNAKKSFICNIFLGVILTPLLSRWSDYYGRKPFMIYGKLTGILPTFTVLAYLKFGLPLWWYYPAKIIDGGFSSSVLAYSYISDLTSPAHRTMIFGLSATPFGIALLLGPMCTILGLIRSSVVAASVGTLLTILGILVLLFFVDESLPEGNRQAAVASTENRRTGLRSMISNTAKDYWMTIQILFRTRYFQKLTFCVVIINMLFEEDFDIQAQYLQEVAGFGTKDQANSLVLTGILVLILESLGLWFITSVLHMPNKQILVLGLAAFGLKMIMFSFCKTKAVAYAAIVVGLFVLLAFPAIASIKSSYVADSEQGAVQGALGSAKSLATGIGPMVFSALYFAARHGSYYFPGLPFLISFFLVVIAVVVAITIYLPPLHNDLIMEMYTGQGSRDENTEILLLEKSENNE